MYLLIYLDMTLSQQLFIVVISTYGVLTPPGYLIKFLPAVSLNWCVSVLCSIMSQTDQIYVAFFLLRFGISIWRILCWYLNYPQNLAKFIRVCCISLFPTLFSFYFCQIFLFEWPFWLSLRWFFYIGWSVAVYLFRIFSTNTSSLTL